GRGGDDGQGGAPRVFSAVGGEDRLYGPPVVNTPPARAPAPRPAPTARQFDRSTHHRVCAQPAAAALLHRVVRASRSHQAVQRVLLPHRQPAPGPARVPAVTSPCFFPVLAACLDPPCCPVEHMSIIRIQAGSFSVKSIPKRRCTPTYTVRWATHRVSRSRAVVWARVESNRSTALH